MASTPWQQGEPTERRPWREAIRGNVLALGLVSLCTDFSSEMMNPLLPIFIAGLLDPGPDLAARAALFVGLMEGLAETASALLKIVSGHWSDRLGKRKALILIGYGLSSLCRPLMALAQNVVHAVAMKLLDRVGKGTRTGPRDALIGDSVDHRYRGLAFSVHRAMDHAGAVAGPVAAIAILYLLLGRAVWGGSTVKPTPEEMRALRWLFAAAVLPGLAAMAALALRVHDVKVSAGRAARTGTGPATTAAAPAARLPGRFYAFVSVVTLFALGNSSDMFIVFLGWTRFGFGLLQVVALWIALHVAKIAFSLPGGILSDRIGRRPVIVTGWLAYALIYLGLALADSSLAYVLLVVAYGFYHGMTEGVEKAAVADFAPPAQRGTAFGIYHGAVGLAALPASLVFGAVWRLYGPAASFGIGAGLAGLAATLLCILLASPGPQPPRT